MLRSINNIPHLSFQGAIETIGISEGYLKRALSGNRKGELKAWDHTKLGREVWINYEELKSSHQKLVQKEYGDPYLYCAAQVIKPLIPRNTAADELTIHTFKINKDTGLPEDDKRIYLEACRWAHFLSGIKARKIKSLGFQSAEQFYEAVLTIIKNEGIGLPTTYSALRKKVRDYKNNGAEVVIKNIYGNTNRKKRNDAIDEWLLTRYAMIDRIDVNELAIEYDKIRENHDWPSLGVSTIYDFLYQEEMRQLWWMGRYGYSSWRKEFEHNLKLSLPSFREGMWCSDGTKLDFWYKDKNASGNMAAKLNIYIVADVYSECIIGWHCDEVAENHDMIYRASKMALNNAGHKPYQWLYDGQGGHKKIKSFFDTACAGPHFSAEAYNAQAKPIEQMFNRFQKQVLKKYWFSTGQSIKSKREESHANMDFIMSHKDELPTKEEILSIVPRIIETWNKAQHPHSEESRLERYHNSENPVAVKIELWDMVDMFWVTSKESITYYKHGLIMQTRNTKYHYEVVDENGLPDLDFLSKYIKAKFYVKFDPEDLSSIQLYTEVEGDLRYVATAHTKESVKRAVIDLEKGDRERIDKQRAIRKQQRAKVENRLQEMTERTGNDSERLLQLNFRGDMKEEVASIGADGALYLADVKEDVRDAYDDLNELPDISKWLKED